MDNMGIVKEIEGVPSGADIKRIDILLGDELMPRYVSELLKGALKADVPRGDINRLIYCFNLLHNILDIAYGDEEKAKKYLPWVLFCLGIAYKRMSQSPNKLAETKA